MRSVAAKLQPGGQSVVRSDVAYNLLLFLGPWSNGRGRWYLSRRSRIAAYSGNPFALSSTVHYLQAKHELQGGGTWGGYEARSRIQAK